MLVLIKMNTYVNYIFKHSLATGSWEPYILCIFLSLLLITRYNLEREKLCLCVDLDLSSVGVKGNLSF